MISAKASRWKYTPCAHSYQTAKLSEANKTGCEVKGKVVDIEECKGCEDFCERNKPCTKHNYTELYRNVNKLAEDMTRNGAFF